jgi:hypothetical protein
MLEAELHIVREVVAELVMLYSIGKDSSVLPARQSVPSGPIPFPLLHIDTTYKVREMIEFRDAERDWRARSSHQRGGDCGRRAAVHPRNSAAADC